MSSANSKVESIRKTFKERFFFKNTERKKQEDYLGKHFFHPVGIL